MLTKTPRTLDSRFGSRNARIMRAREIAHHESMIAMLETNLAWRERAWNTPDMAMCLGRYTRD